MWDYLTPFQVIYENSRLTYLDFSTSWGEESDFNPRIRWFSLYDLSGRN
jgi:hypothetical protein